MAYELHVGTFTDEGTLDSAIDRLDHLRALGVAIVGDLADLPAAMVGCFAYADTAMLEALVVGTEVAVTVIEEADGSTRALPAVEIVPDSGVYDYASRYTAGTTEFFAPARLDQDVAAECARVALAAHERLGLRHLSRADLIVDRAGQVTFLEVNVAPGCTETSLLPQAVEVRQVFVFNQVYSPERVGPTGMRHRQLRFLRALRLSGLYQVSVHAGQRVPGHECA